MRDRQQKNFSMLGAYRKIIPNSADCISPMSVQQCDATTPTLLTQAQTGSAEFVPSVNKLRANILQNVLKYACETAYTETALHESCITLTLVYCDGLNELP
jgi:hypothetical protein